MKVKEMQRRKRIMEREYRELRKLKCKVCNKPAVLIFMKLGFCSLEHKEEFFRRGTLK